MRTDDTRPVCFIVMGFGKKTDYETGRTLDLDATYDAIIKPAVMAAGLRGIRSDEIIQSGTIDIKMYEMLLRADLVIADISTGNVNAVYELGVRHALRPSATIVMKEDIGKLYFDLDHTSTFSYNHLGRDIGHKEALRAQAALKELIEAALKSGAPDSPIYTFLPRLKQPRLSDEEYEEALVDLEATQERLSLFIHAAQHSFSEGNFVKAADGFLSALNIKPGEPYLLQQLALATYKSESPSPLEALIQGLRILDDLNPETSNDPETLGISGAIRKRLWLMTSDRIQLDTAIRYYKRGFELTRNYYNGENLALCFTLRSTLQDERSEAEYDALSAKKVCLELVETLSKMTYAETFLERSDCAWIFATLAFCHDLLGHAGNSQEAEKKFVELFPQSWMLETFELNKQLLKNHKEQLAKWQ